MAGEQDNGQDSHGAEGILVAGRYRLIERLGAGGMGRVWRAHDESLDCDVAVKEVWLPPMLSDSERAERLERAQREARNAARMRNHPHIVSVHDMVSDKGMPWIVMDLIPSQNLLQAVERHGPLPQEQVAKIGLGVLDALTASHAAGILHRDVKPANVLLTTDGRVLLTDFGIAVQEADLTMTASGVLIGSPEYVAPERARGEASDGASDLFSLGATLFFATEGRSPFLRDTAVGVLTAILFEETAPVTRVPALAPLISGLLTKDPGDPLERGPGAGGAGAAQRGDAGWRDGESFCAGDDGGRDEWEQQYSWLRDARRVRPRLQLADSLSAAGHTFRPHGPAPHLPALADARSHARSNALTDARTEEEHGAQRRPRPRCRRAGGRRRSRRGDRAVRRRRQEDPDREHSPGHHPFELDFSASFGPGLGSVGDGERAGLLAALGHADHGLVHGSCDLGLVLDGPDAVHHGRAAARDIHGRQGRRVHGDQPLDRQVRQLL